MDKDPLHLIRHLDTPHVSVEYSEPRQGFLKGKEETQAVLFLWRTANARTAEALSSTRVLLPNPCKRKPQKSTELASRHAG